MRAGLSLVVAPSLDKLCAAGLSKSPHVHADPPLVVLMALIVLVRILKDQLTHLSHSGRTVLPQSVHVHVGACRNDLRRRFFDILGRWPASSCHRFFGRIPRIIGCSHHFAGYIRANVT